MKTPRKKTKLPKPKHNTKRITEFLNAIDWLFQINNFDKQIVVKTEEQGKVSAEIIFDQEYQRITVNILPCFFASTLEEQRRTLLHELCHAITLPSKHALHDLYDGKLLTPEQIKRINEEETSKIECILDGLLRSRLRYALKAYEDYLK